MSVRTSPVLVALTTAMGVALVLALVFSAAPVAPAFAQGAATWELAPQPPPQPPTGVAGSSTPIALGRIGDIEFWAPNRGLLITAGNPPTIPAGVWAYNGEAWHELANVCGASDGRIAWAGPDEFWTVSDGRPGQTVESAENPEPPPLEDNTLCHFAGGQIVGSVRAPRLPGRLLPGDACRGLLRSRRLLVRGRPAGRTADRRLPAALERQRARGRTLRGGRARRREHEPTRRGAVRGRAGLRRRSRDDARSRTAGRAPHQPDRHPAHLRTGNRSAAVRRRRATRSA